MNMKVLEHMRGNGLRNKDCRGFVCGMSIETSKGKSDAKAQMHNKENIVANVGRGTKGGKRPWSGLKEVTFLCNLQAAPFRMLMLLILLLVQIWTQGLLL